MFDLIVGGAVVWGAVTIDQKLKNDEATAPLPRPAAVEVTWFDGKGNVFEQKTLTPGRNGKVTMIQTGIGKCKKAVLVVEAKWEHEGMYVEWKADSDSCGFKMTSMVNTGRSNLEAISEFSEIMTPFFGGAATGLKARWIPGDR